MQTEAELNKVEESWEHRWEDEYEDYCDSQDDEDDYEESDGEDFDEAKIDRYLNGGVY